MAGLFKYKTNFLKTKSFAYKGDAMYVPSGSMETMPLHSKWNMGMGSTEPIPGKYPYALS